MGVFHHPVRPMCSSRPCCLSSTTTSINTYLSVIGNHHQLQSEAQRHAGSLRAKSLALNTVRPPTTGSPPPPLCYGLYTIAPFTTKGQPFVAGLLVSRATAGTTIVWQPWRRLTRA
jgi:hypothetical protein